jgi:very-short-patch-repair endonuclease
MINEIYVNGTKVIGFDYVKIKRHKNCRFQLENNEFVITKNITNIQYVCIECKNMIDSSIVKMQYFKDTEYRCRSCSVSGDRNGFYKKTHTDEFKKKLSDERKGTLIGDNNPMYGKSVYDVWLEKYGKEIADEKFNKMKFKASITNKGKNNPFFGKTHTDESIEKIINANKKYRKNLTDTDRLIISERCSKGQRKAMHENPSNYRRIKSKAARASHISQFSNKSMNKIEKTVYEYIKQYDDAVEFSVILASYQFDFGIKSKKLLIEVDGDYWHGNPLYYNLDGSGGKRMLNETQLKKMERDIEKTQWAESRGFTIIRIWEDEINNNTFNKKLDGHI